jgi:hypothetical protein
MTLVNRRVLQETTLLLAALFAMFWAILRARVQSMTIDESVTYTMFVHGWFRTVFVASSNNHVLNSLLMWITTNLFGNSPLSVRMPALMGAALYIFICYFLCQSITSRFILRFSLFLCLTYNPLIFDFMVAGRGYSLADAFLLLAIAVPVFYRVKGRPSRRTCCVLASLGLGLSFTANFSFAFVDFAAFLFIVSWAVRRREGESTARVVAYCTLPGLSVALLICGYTLAHWRSGELWFGARSFSEMTRGLVDASLYQLDPRFGQSAWYQIVELLKPWLLPLLGILCVCQVVVTRLQGSWFRDERTPWLGKLAAALAGIATLSLLMHWLAFRVFKLPLPMGRTGIYLVPLCTLVAGIIGAEPTRSAVSRWLRRSITAVFICLACYFLLCLRMNYFKEWEWDADVKDVYPVLVRLKQTYGVTDIGTSWLFVASLNYYRVQSNREDFPEFMASLPDPPPGKSIYVLHRVTERAFLENEKLVVVYRGKSTDVVIAVKPDGPIPATMIER